MSRSAEAWRTDWKAFVDHIASLRAAGRSDQEICEELAGKRVSFEGRIEAFMLDDDCAPGLQMRMTPVTASLPRGKVLRASFAGLNVETPRHFKLEAFRHWRPHSFHRSRFALERYHAGNLDHLESGFT
jgi:hypothetical protein